MNDDETDREDSIDTLISYFLQDGKEFEDFLNEPSDTHIYYHVLIIKHNTDYASGFLDAVEQLKGRIS